MEHPSSYEGYVTRSSDCETVMFEENVKLFVSNQMENLLGGESCLEDVFSSQQKGDFHLNDCVRVLQSKVDFFFFFLDCILFS